MSAPRPVLIMAGGTGGHIFPGLAVARALRERDVPVLWLGSDGGMETRLVPGHGVDIATIAVSGVRGKGWKTLMGAPFALWRAVRQAANVMRERDPRAVVSFGGFAAGPGGIAAWLQRRPLIVHEQNRSPGMTNRVLAKVAARVLCGFPDSFAGVRSETVGNPVRAEIAALPSPEQRFEGRAGPIRLLVLGGSQGARAINTGVPEAIASLRGQHDFEIRHQCGEKMVEQTNSAYLQSNVIASIEPFISDMATAYGWADLVIGRAGALTVAELCAAGVASILVPFPGAVDDHQARNADYLKQCGAGDWLRQDDGLQSGLVERIGALAGDRPRLLAMARAARAAAFPDAAAVVANVVLQEARA